MKILYPRRHILLIFAIILLTSATWLVIADWLPYTTTGRNLLATINNILGLWPTVDHTIRGLAGIWPASPASYAITLFVGFTLFFATQIAFIAPRHNYAQQLTRTQREHASTIISIALVAAMLTAGIAASITQTLGLWQSSQTPSDQWLWIGRQNRSLGLMKSFYLIAIVFIPAFIAWAYFFHRTWKPFDAFQRRLHTLFIIFTVGGLLAFTAGMTMIITMISNNPSGIAFTGEWWRTGHYTAVGFGLAATLWSALPAITLLFAQQTYQRTKRNQCLHCGYDLRHHQPNICPECGQPIQYPVPTPPSQTP